MGAECSAECSAEYCADGQTQWEASVINMDTHDDPVVLDKHGLTMVYPVTRRLSRRRRRPSMFRKIRDHTPEYVEQTWTNFDSKGVVVSSPDSDDEQSMVTPANREIDNIMEEFDEKASPCAFGNGTKTSKMPISHQHPSAAQFESKLQRTTTLQKPTTAQSKPPIPPQQALAALASASAVKV